MPSRAVRPGAARAGHRVPPQLRVRDHARGQDDPRLLIEASATHDVRCGTAGFESVELHLRRVQARVASGGHDIPEDRIRERWTASRRNLIRLLPHLASLQVLRPTRPSPHPAGDPPADPAARDVDGEHAEPPTPPEPEQLAAIPDWAKPLVEAAIRLQESR